MERDTRGLMLAIGALSPADRATLVKMIRDYLISKGIDPAKYADKGWDGTIKGGKAEISEIKKDTREEIKDMRQTTRDAMKAKRDEMMTKIKEIKGNSEGKKEFVGHVSLLK